MKETLVAVAQKPLFVYALTV